MSLPSPAQPSRTRPATLGRRWIPRVLAIVPVLAGAAVLAPSAHADTGYGYCQAASCNGKDPIAENCQVNAYTVSSYTETIQGFGSYTVDLRYSPDCEANWARVTTATAEYFCVEDSLGDLQGYTSTPGVVSWTNMVNGNAHDYAFSYVPDSNVVGIEADDTGEPNGSPWSGPSTSTWCH